MKSVRFVCHRYKVGVPTESSDQINLWCCMMTAHEGDGQHDSPFIGLTLCLVGRQQLQVVYSCSLHWHLISQIGHAEDTLLACRYIQQIGPVSTEQ